MLAASVGQILLNDALPSDLRDYSSQLDKKGITKLYEEVARRYPDQFAAIAKRLQDLSRQAAYRTGGLSFDLEHLKLSKAAQQALDRLRGQMRGILSSQRSDAEKQTAIQEAVDHERATLSKKVYDEALAAKNPLAMQVATGARGNQTQLSSLIGLDLLYEDAAGKTVPFPILKNFSQGLSPAEYYASAFGARKGVYETKMGTARGGYIAKQMAQLAHRLLVTQLDDDDKDPAMMPGGVRGLPVDTMDEDNTGALLARETGPYPKHTIMNPRIAADLKNRGFARILLRSPAVGGPGDGVFARDVGVRERGTLPPLGDMVGITASQALSEKLTQGMLSSKHSAGVKGAAPAASGFRYVEGMLQAPEQLTGAASHAQLDGRVQQIQPAPAGGAYVFVDGEKHYVPGDQKVAVKVGDQVEAGDVLSNGLPHPAEVVKHKGIGEGRRYFINKFREVLKNSGAAGHRRNIELIARGLIDHVEMLDESDHYLPGDVMSYQQLERNWQPREGYQTVEPQTAVGKYLERPVLHHSIGTKIRKHMLPELKEFGIHKIDVHDQPPPFQPIMIRAMDNLQHDPDPIASLLGGRQKDVLLNAAHRGLSSDTKGTSYVPSLASGTRFGIDWPQSVLKPP